MDVLERFREQLLNGGSDAYSEEFRTRVAAQVPLAFSLTLGSALLSSVIDGSLHPDRLPVIVALDALLIVILGVSRFAQRRDPARVLPILVATVALLGLGLHLYHFAVRADPAMAVWTTTGLLCGAGAFLTWGWAHQATVSALTLLSYPLLVARLPAPVEENLGKWAAGGAYLLIVVALSVLGAHLINGYLRSRFALTCDLSEREARLRSYFELSSVGTAILTLERQWIDVNPALADMLGMTPRDLVARDWSELLDPSDREADRAQFSCVLNGGLTTSRRESLFQRRDGSALHAVVTLRLLPAGGEEPQRLLAIVQDVDDLRRDRDRLRAARDAAERDRRTKSELLANMSHEIRTPLNVIFGMTDIALEAAENPEQREALQRTRGATHSLLTLVDDVLDYSRMEAGKLDLQSSTFVVRPWLRDVVEPLWVLARGKNLALEIEVGPEVPERVSGDAGRLRQVIVNLVSNAIKFTDHGRVAVVVRCDPEPPSSATGHGSSRDGSRPRSGRKLHVVVEDSGAGIAREDQQRIFEEFTQTASAGPSHPPGTGLGLAICSRLVRLMKGRIWVESEPGHGSRFHFTADLSPISGERPTH